MSSNKDSGGGEQLSEEDKSGAELEEIAIEIDKKEINVTNESGDVGKSKDNFMEKKEYTPKCPVGDDKNRPKEAVTKVGETSKQSTVLPETSNKTTELAETSNKITELAETSNKSTELAETSNKSTELAETSNKSSDNLAADEGPSTKTSSAETDLQNSSRFRRPKRRLSNRVYRRRSGDNSSREEDGEDEDMAPVEDNAAEEDDDDEPDEIWLMDSEGGGGIGQTSSRLAMHEGLCLTSSSSSSSSDTMDFFERPDPDEVMDDKDDKPMPKVLLKPKPRHKWFVVQEVINRQMGVGSRWQGSELFQQRCYGSLHAVQRLELMYKLEVHRGCVNTLNFNPSGTLLASASDDCKVALWNWALGKCVSTYESGHSSNVFQAKFLPLTGDRHIVSCARDGQVRLAVLTGAGVCRTTRQLAQHKRPAHKIATQPETPHVFLSAGEDAVVMSLDVREHKHKKLMWVKDSKEKVALYSIHSNPINCHEFIVTGDDHFVRLYDKRKISADGIAMKRFCPQHLMKSEVFIHVTCAVFNYNGTEILGSFNDEDIYLFDKRHSDGADYVHRYEGHRNSVTVKGVNFFGPRSQYIVSGSDCGNIFFWDKETESIVQWMRGDEEGVVNCLEPHPQVPVLATSGLDYDIKIWVPSCEQEPTFDGLKTAVQFNHTARERTNNRSRNPWDIQMQWLWRRIRHFGSRRGVLSESRGAREGRDGGNGSEESSSSSQEDELQDGQPECSPS